MSPDLLERVPPQNLDAERSALGAMFLDKEAIYRAMEILRPDDFYKDAHRHIYQTVLDLANKGEPVDLVTVTEALRQSKRLDEVGGVAYLTELANAVPTAAHIDHYARIIEESLIAAVDPRGRGIMAPAMNHGRKSRRSWMRRSGRFSVANRVPGGDQQPETDSNRSLRADRVLI